MLKKGIFAVVAFLSFLVLPLSGQGKWETIFNGKDLKGWEQKNGTATYRVEGGTIIGKTEKGSPNSFLCSGKEYGDFELEFDVKLLDDELNSGVQIRSNTKKPEAGQKYGTVNGPQVEIEAGDAGGSVSGYIYGESFTNAWLTPQEKRVMHKAFKSGEWNTYRIVAKGARIQTWINGKPVDDLTDESAYKSHPKGFIGLQVHGVGDNGPFQVAWKNIRIRTL